MDKKKTSFLFHLENMSDYRSELGCEWCLKLTRWRQLKKESRVSHGDEKLNNKQD